MTAQEWLDELERLREAATPGPWKHNIEPRRDGMGRGNPVTVSRSYSHDRRRIY